MPYFSLLNEALTGAHIAGFESPGDRQAVDTLLGVAIWPVFIWRPMLEERGLELSIGQQVAWIVEIVDGGAMGWPDDVLVDTTLKIERRPHVRSVRGALARTGEFQVLWEGEEAVGSVLRFRAGLSAEWFMPAFRTVAEGVIRHIQLVSRQVGWDAEKTRVTATGAWHLEDVERSPRWLGRSPRPDDPREALFLHGLLVALDLQQITLRDQ